MQDVDLPSGETEQRVMADFHLAMYLESKGIVRSPKRTWQEDEYFASRAGSRGPGGPGAGVEGAAPASGAGTEPGGEGGRLTPEADAALRQARAGTQGAATAAGAGAPVPASEPSPSDLAAIAAANARRELEEDPGSKPGEDLEEEEVPSDFCYPFILMAGAWGRSDRRPAEWKYLGISDGPPTRSNNEKGAAVVHKDSTIGSKPAVDRACPNGDPVSRRRAAAFRAEQEKKAAQAEADKENKKRASEEADNKRKRLEVLQAATAEMTNVATSLAKMAVIKEAEQASKKRQKRIDALTTKLKLGLGNESDIRKTLTKLLDEEES